jgi:hypothetical protein
VPEDKTKALKKCGWCGKEIEDDNYFTISHGNKLVGMFCRKCYSEDKKLNKRIREM